jgi:hypothetical protein
LTGCPVPRQRSTPGSPTPGVLAFGWRRPRSAPASPDLDQPSRLQLGVLQLALQLTQASQAWAPDSADGDAVVDRRRRNSATRTMSIKRSLAAATSQSRTENPLWMAKEANTP